MTENTPQLALESSYDNDKPPIPALRDRPTSNRVADLAPNGAVMLDLTLIDDWRHVLRSEGKTSATIRRYLQAPRGFARWTGDGAEGWRHVEQRHIRRYLGWLEDSDYSPSHCTLQFVALRSFFQFLQDEGELVNPMARMKGRKVPAPPVAILSRDDIGRMIEAARKLKEPFRAARGVAMIMVLADAGLRLGELHGLMLEDIELSGDAAVLAVTGKGSKKRVVVVGDKTRMALRRYLRERDKHPSRTCEAFWLGRQGPLSYPATYKVIRDCGLKAGISVHPHQLRHTWAHEFRVAGGQLDDLAVLGGWSDFKTVARYGASAAQVRAITWASKHSLGDRL